MNKSLFQELDPNEKYSIKLSIFGNDIFPNITIPHRSNSNPASIINNNIISNLDSSNSLDNIQKKNISNISSKTKQDNPINQIIIEDNNDNKNVFFESSSETSKNSQSNESNKTNNIISVNLFNSNFYGFKGRSPYTTPNLNNMLNNNILNMNKRNNYIKKDNIKSYKINSKTQNNINKNQKRNDIALVTQLKDKILEYRCSICNFVANEYKELHKHLASFNHYTLPKKLKKGKKQKIFYKSENKMNETFIYTISRINDNNLEKKLFCKHCGKKFDSKFGLNAHLNMHKYKCELCYKSFNTKDELMKHYDIESFYIFRKANNYNTKKDNKFNRKKVKMEINDWEDTVPSKKELCKSDEKIYKKNFDQSYAFIDDSDEYLDINKMVKINDKSI